MKTSDKKANSQSSNSDNNQKESNQKLSEKNRNSNTSLSYSNNNENQTTQQNQNIFNSSLNFPSKEYFNYSFFKRQMSSRSSDLDNKEGINEFFNIKAKSLLSKDSEKNKSTNSKKSSELNTSEFLLPNLSNKEEILTRANSDRTKKRSSNNYIPKTVFFQRNNSTTPSCFYKKNNNIKDEDDNKNPVLKYYGNNKNNILEMVNDKDDEGEEDDKDDDDDEDNDDDDDDDCILTKKDNENFTVNYISENKGKNTFSLFLRNNQNNKLDKDKIKKGDENNNIKNNKDIDILLDNKDKDNKNTEEKDIKITTDDITKNDIKDDNIKNIINEFMNYDKKQEINNLNHIDKGNYFLNDKILFSSKNEIETNKEKDKKNNIIMINKKDDNMYEQAPNISINKMELYPFYNEHSNVISLTRNIKEKKSSSLISEINEIEELINNAHELIKDQKGCRLIQKKINENPNESNKLFDVLYQDLSSMCRDLFGNYVVQKILENVDSNYLIKFIDIISKDFYALSISIYGTRVVQKFLGIVSDKSLIKNENDKIIYEKCFKEINNHITKNIVALSSNNNSSHIIIKYVNEIKYPENNQLYNEVYNNFIPLCKDKHGCCVIQKCIEFGNNEQKNKLIELSSINCDTLISDQFGNYVIQFVLTLNEKVINLKVYKILSKNLISLCKEKYASNVIEKFLMNKSKESIEIINILLNNENYLYELIIDSFGNYIIQRILSLIEGESKSNLIYKIVKWYPDIKKLSFGPRIISKLHERFPEFTSLVTQKYGWETTRETAGLMHNNNYLRNNLLRNNNNNFSNLNNNNILYLRNLNMLNNNINNVNNNRGNNNNFMNFRNGNNVGNINFIQMNNYMLTNGQNNLNNLRFPLNNFEEINNINNLNGLNHQIFPNLNNNNIKADISYPSLYDKDFVQRLYLLGINNNIPFINNFKNNNINYQNLMNYNKYVNNNIFQDKNNSNN